MKKNKLFTLLILLPITGFYSCNHPVSEKTSIVNTSHTMKIEKKKFGKVDNKQVDLYSLCNKKGMTVQITNYGGIVTSILVPDKNGEFDDVVLGYDHLKGYLDQSPYFGAIVGRYANRIAKGRFTLNDTEYRLAVNNGLNHLHGGIKGFDKVVWDANPIETDSTVGVKLQYLSKDMEEGYPGNLNVTVKYLLDNKNRLRIDYSATTDKPTYVNLSNHSYFNLAGSSGRDILGQYLWIDANHYTVVDETLIPTGEQRPVKNTPMDFTRPTSVGERIGQVEGGYDHNYVLNNNDGSLAKVASLTDSVSGRKMEVYTTQPGLQFYSGNFLDGSIIGKFGMNYRQHFGLCLEAQHFPDSPNHPDFPSTQLSPGEEYHQVTIYQFAIEK